MGGDPRRLPQPDIHLPGDHIDVARYNDPGMIMADGALAGASQMALEATGAWALKGIGSLLSESKSVWASGALARGRAIEKMLGENLGWNFPTIDKIENGVATSIKSIDLTASSYQKGNNVFNTIKGYVNKLSTFSEATWGGKTVREGEQFTSKMLELAVQTGKGSESQWNQINQAIQYALDNNVNVTIRFIK